MYPFYGSWTVICLKHFQSEFNISTKGIINNEFTSKSFFTFVWFLNDLWNSHVSFIEVLCDLYQTFTYHNFFVVWWYFRLIGITFSKYIVNILQSATWSHSKLDLWWLSTKLDLIYHHLRSRFFRHLFQPCVPNHRQHLSCKNNENVRDCNSFWTIKFLPKGHSDNSYFCLNNTVNHCCVMEPQFIWICALVSIVVKLLAISYKDDSTTSRSVIFTI